MASIPRLYLTQPLGQGQSVMLPRDNAHYLFNVMRLGVGAQVEIFNGTDGTWLARVVEARKHAGVLICDTQIAPQQSPPDLWLCFAPIKKARTDFIVEKATEMGATRIQPMQTDFTNAERIRQDRLQAHAVEAAEQCGGNFVPEVAGLQKMTALIQNWPEDRQILFCDEETLGPATVLGAATPGSWAVFVGPEGGFSPAERQKISHMPQTTVASLGPRILRADTAAVAALTLWQAHLGDWT